jgi:hypothetical protein
MSSTGPIESWNVNPFDVGPLYPFAGWETWMFAACVAFCVVFMYWKFATESAKYRIRARTLRESDELARVLGALPRTTRLPHDLDPLEQEQAPWQTASKSANG